MVDWIGDPQIWASLLTLTALEIVLGIDNVIFISIVADKLPESERRRARALGLGGALVIRIALLAVIAWIIGLTAPLFELLGRAISWRDLILLGGGLFLLVKATHEIHQAVEGPDGRSAVRGGAEFATVIVQIMLLDLVFSFDSIVTAVGMAQHLAVMVAAVVIAMVVMFVASGPISDFVSRHPTVKMLALSFLILIGVALVADGLQFHIPKGYLYFAVAFSALVEGLNLAAARRRKLRRADGPAAD
ncbi:MAG: TerC family protein [Kiloniellales bacterium]|nr:TerC family protein [Kiloniellales bacterium]